MRTQVKRIAVGSGEGAQQGRGRRGGGAGAAASARRVWMAGLLRAVALTPLVLAAGSADAASAKLSLSAVSLTFPSADPDAAPAIPAAENPLQVKVQVNGPAWTTSQLSVQVAGDLISGADSIPIESITWSADGSGFVAGRLAGDSSQLVGQWTDKTNVSGNLTFWLANSWSYAVGDYSQNLVYTLIAY